MTAALGWDLSRFGPKEGFRMGNYLLLSYVGQNLAKEFIYGGPHTLVRNMPMMHHEQLEAAAWPDFDRIESMT
jgi:hypothetical protein